MKRSSGFTLIELLVTIAIVVIIMALGTPSYQYVTNSNRMASEVNALLGDMQYARAEAIKEGIPVTVCTSSNGTSCSGSTSWQNGWIIFSDNNGNATVDAGDIVLRKQISFSGSDTFAADTTTNAGAVTFSRAGFATNLNNTATLTLNDITGNSKWRRCLVINRVGRMTSQAAGASNCT